MDLQTVWFLLIAVLWAGYLTLEGFDFGVGMLMFVIGRNTKERDALFHSYGPFWDANEVWLLTAGGAMFAAFPNWYASMFSAMYLPLLLLLVALIVRVMAIEYRRKLPDNSRWTDTCDRIQSAASLVAPLTVAIALANVVRGIKLDADHNYTGNVLDFFGPYALLGGVAVVMLFLLHGATFLGIRTEGELNTRAHSLAKKLWLPTTVLVGAFGLWTLVGPGPSGTPAAEGAGALTIAFFVLAVVGLLATGFGVFKAVDRAAFAGTAMAILSAVGLLFSTLWPYVLPSIDNPAGSVTVSADASSPYTLEVMTWVAVLLLPVVLAYQAWTFWVFRKRVSVAS